MKNQFFLGSEAARELNVSATTVREMERRGDLPATRTPTGTRIFSAADIQKVKAEREKQNQNQG